MQAFAQPDAFQRGRRLRAPLAARRTTNAFQPLPAVAAAAATRLKDAFDPRGVLNPGRMD